jgi:hypothetical protein
MKLDKVTLKTAPTITSRPIRVGGRSRVVFEADAVIGIDVACNDLDAVLGQKTGGRY